MPGAGGSRDRRPDLAGRPVHGHALRGGGRSVRRGARRRRRHGRLQADRRADRLPPGPVHHRCPRRLDRSDCRPPGLARGLRLHDRSRRPGAQRVRPPERPLRPGWPDLGDGRCRQRGAGLAQLVPDPLDGEELRRWRPGRHGAVDRHRRGRRPAAAHRGAAAEEPAGRCLAPRRPRRRPRRFPTFASLGLPSRRGRCSAR